MESANSTVSLDDGRQQGFFCAAARNVNFNDSTVMETWSNKMFASDVKCIELPDGTSVTPKEGIEWAVENVK